MTRELICPRCGTTLAEHEAGRGTDYCVEVVVFDNPKPLPGDAGILLPYEALLRHYSTSIADAWEVAKEINQDNAMNLRWYNPEGRTSEFSVTFGFGIKVEGNGPTVELAICRAALEVVISESTRES
jgi:hypothetical protein